MLIENGTTEYVLVRDYKASNAVINAVNSMVNSIKANIGADITIKECFNDLEDEPLDVVTEKEILIGMTNRPESIEALDGMRSKDYTISNHGTKLVIGGGGEEGTIAAILCFIQLICEQGNSHAVSDGALLDLTFATENETVFRDQYSYDSVTLLGTSISSFGLIYPKHADNSTECKELAAQIAAHVSNESGYELKTYKDTRYWCDYEILIGDTIRTDDDLVDSLGKDEYYIRLIKTEVTYEDDSKHPGGQLIICFGEDAADDALEAFKTLVLPPQDTPTDLALQNEFELTNRNT